MENTGYLGYELASPQTVQHIYENQIYETPNSQTQREINQLMAALNIESEDILEIDDVQKRFDELISTYKNDVEAHFSDDEAVGSWKSLDGEGYRYVTVGVEQLDQEMLSYLACNDEKDIHLEDKQQTQAPQFGDVELFKDALCEPEKVDSSKDEFSGCNFEVHTLYPALYAVEYVPEIVFEDDSAPEARSRHSHDENSPESDSKRYKDDCADRSALEHPVATYTGKSTASPVFYYQAVYKNRFINPSFSGIFKTTAQSNQSQTGAYLPDTQNILLQLQETQGLHDTAPYSNAFSSTQPARKAENVKIDNDNQMDITDITQNDVEVYSMTEYYQYAPTVLYQPNQAEQFDHIFKSPEKEATEPVNSQANRVRLRFRWSGQSAALAKCQLKLSVK